LSHQRITMFDFSVGFFCFSFRARRREAPTREPSKKKRANDYREKKPCAVWGVRRL